MADWSQIREKYLKKGYDHGYAAHMADEYMKRKEKLREHISSRWCWCEPYLDYVDPDNGNEVWVHREVQ